MQNLQGRPVLALAFGLAGLAAACGDSGEAPPQKTVTAAEVRDLYGMNPGSCYQYRLPSSALATVTLEENDGIAISGYKVIKRSYVAPGSSLAEEEYYDFDTKPGEVRLLREVRGFNAAERSTKSYVEYRAELDREGTVGPGVLVFDVEYDRQNTLVVKPAPYTTATTPIVSAGGNTMSVEAETHEWSRLGEEQVMTPEGMVTATTYNYQRPGAENARFALVPGFGFARIQDFNNVAHQICAARVCKADGSCTGAASCQELSCP